MCRDLDAGNIAEFHDTMIHIQDAIQKVEDNFANFNDAATLIGTRLY